MRGFDITQQAARVTAALALGTLGALPANAHDFWVQPDRYWSQPNVSIPITLQVGHGRERQRSPIRQNRIIRFAAVTPAGEALELRANLHLQATMGDGRLQFQTPGTYLVVLQTDHRGRSALSAHRFNEYIQAEGLAGAIEQRQRTGRMSAAGSESYARVAKALVQIGVPDARSQSNVTTPLGLPLEIVPERNPYLEPLSADFAVRVIFEGEPLAGALMKLTRLEDDGAPREQRRTDGAGRASFKLPRTGSWLLNVVWTRPATPPAEVDFETTFSSLSFGFPAEPVADRRP